MDTAQKQKKLLDAYAEELSVAPFAREVANLLMAEDLSAHIVTLDMARRVSVPAYNIILHRDALLSPLAQRFLSLIAVEIG